MIAHIEIFRYFCLYTLFLSIFSRVIRQVYIDYGQNLGVRVTDRIRYHLHRIESLQVYHISQLGIIPPSNPRECLLLGFGDSSLSNMFISSQELSLLPYESFRMIQSKSHHYVNQCQYVAVTNGLPLNMVKQTNVSFSKMTVHYGAVVGSYALLEHLGFRFLHPLESYAPSTLRVSCNWSESCDYNLTESPYWPERAFHIHTQHPLELTEVLQGYDIPQFGPHGPFCSKYSQRRDNDTGYGRSQGVYCERWEDMVDDVNRMYEWMIANRLNKVEWLLLGNFKWGDEADTRIKRFRILTYLAHDYSLLVGADCPLVNQQQHGWFMVDPSVSTHIQLQSIRDRVDWIFQAGFDFITTESGLSEFTHPDCELMLTLINEFADYANKTWGREAAIKVHCSTGQKCDGFLDPNTGEPVNFNFLTMFATSSLGILPHTVQVYALDDPTAGAYGNDNFSYMEDYMVYEAKQGNRSVMFYGETAYWVNVDIDVPLFLLLYGQRRQHDLRRIAMRERREGFRIQGQMNFDSGWEWGYWLSDVVTARASWDPMLPTLSSDQEKTYGPRLDQWEVFSKAIEPFTSIFKTDEDDHDNGNHYNNDQSHLKIDIRLNKLLVSLTKDQERLIIFGRVNDSIPCPDIRKLSGIAYMSGSDTWIDIPRMFGLPILQADKVRMKETSDPLWPYVLPLLNEMERVFTQHTEDMKSIYHDAVNYRTQDTCLSLAVSPMFLKSKSVETMDGACNKGEAVYNAAAIGLLKEILDCIQLLSMRAKHVRMLYESMVSQTATEKANLQRQSRAVISSVSDIVHGREQNYRVPWQRVATWRENPTVYRYGYLWAVHSLYYWWRDQGLAEGGSLQSEHSPCYLNRIDASEVAVGWGRYTLEVIRTVINWLAPFFSWHPFELVNCFSPPPEGYEFPRDLYPM